MDYMRNYVCNVCNISCNSVDQMRIHMSGRKHTGRCCDSVDKTSDDSIKFYAPLQRTPDKDVDVCFNCNNNLTLSELLCHYCPIDDSSNGYTPLYITDDESLQINKYDASYDSFIKIVNSSFYCELCSTKLNSVSQVDMHLKGKKHLRKSRLNSPLNAQTESANILRKEIDVLDNSSEEGKADSSVCDCGISQSISLTSNFDNLSSETTYLENGSLCINSTSIFFSESNQPSPEENSFPNGFLNEDSDNGLRSCDLCNVSLNSSAQFKIHLVGKKHLKNAKKVLCQK